MTNLPSFPRVLIVGCGDVGNRLAQRLLADNWQVWGMRRDTSRLSPGVHAIAGDFCDPACWRQAPEEVDYLLFTGTATERNESGYRQAYVDGVNSMLAAAHAMPTPPKRLFFTSSTAVYHQHQGETVNERSPTHPPGFNGTCMLEAEEALNDSSFATTNIRFSGIYGPGRGRLIQRALDGRGCELDPSPITNRIHSDDCAGVLHHLLTLDRQGELLDNLYIASDHKPCSLDEILNWLANVLDIKLTPAVKQRSEISSKHCANTRLLNSGYRFIHPDYRSGYGALLKAR